MQGKMDCICYYTHLQFGLWNAWIPSFGLVLIQFLFMMFFRDTAKRATDTTWYSKADRRHARWSFVWQTAILALSLFVPLRLYTPFFLVGLVLFALALVGFLAAFISYWRTPLDKTVQGGVYKLSRNPMYFFFSVGMIATCIASTSLWLLIVTVLLIYETHQLILGEEHYCAATYGEEYLNYKARTPRYFLFF